MNYMVPFQIKRNSDGSSLIFLQHKKYPTFCINWIRAKAQYGNHVLYSRIVTCPAACVTHGCRGVWQCGDSGVSRPEVPICPPNSTLPSIWLKTPPSVPPPRSASNWMKWSFHHMTLDLAETGTNCPSWDRLGRFVFSRIVLLSPACWIDPWYALASIVNTLK